MGKYSRRGNNLHFRKAIYLFFILVILLNNLGISFELYEVILTTNSSVSDFPIISPQPHQLITSEKNPFEFSKVGAFDYGFGSPRDIVVQGELAFIASEWGGLLIFNVSDLSQPELIAIFDEDRSISSDYLWSSSSEVTSGVFVEDDLVFLADGENGLLIINISKSISPQLVGKFHVDNNLFRVYVKSFIAYVISGNAHEIFQIIDLSVPNSPSMKGEINYENEGIVIKECIVRDNYAFLATNTKFIVIDVSNPFNPVEITRVNNLGGNTLALYDNYALLTSSTEIKIINISNPNQPLYINSTAFNVEYIDSICLKGNTVYLSDWGSPKIIAVDLSDIYNPVQISTIGNFDVGISEKNLAVNDEYTDGDIVFCAEKRGLFIFNFTSPADVELLSYFDTGSRAMEVKVVDQYAYLCSWKQSPYYPSSFEILSLENISSPSLLGRYICWNHTISDVSVSNGYAYLSIVSYGLQILDIHDPTSPALVGWVNDSENMRNGLFYDESSSIVYLTAGWDGVLIIDCHIPKSPVVLGHYQKSGYFVSEVFLEGNYLYLGTSDDSGSLIILDVTNPASPLFKSIVSSGSDLGGMYIANGFAFLTTDSPLLVVYDISDPLHPAFVSSLSNGMLWGQAVAVSGTTAFIAQYAAGLRAVDISKLDNPKEIAAIRDHYNGLSFDVFIQDDYIFVADSWDGLEIYQLVRSQLLSKTTIILLSTLIPCGLVITIGTFFVFRRRKKTDAL